MQSQLLSSATWTFRDASTKTWRPAEVPGCVHLDLRRNGQIPDPFFGTNELELQWIEERDWEYRARFKVTADLLSEEVVELVAEGLDTVATVTLNGKVIARTENMFTPYRWNVKKLLEAGANELLIRFDSAMAYLRTHHDGNVYREFNDPVGNSNRIRKQQCQFGWDWGPRLVTAGVWRPLSLEAWSGNRLDQVVVKQTHGDDGAVSLDLTPELARPDADAVCRWTLKLDGKVVTRGEGAHIAVPNPQLWWPAGQGAQPLYTLSVEVVDATGATIGTWQRKIGLRTIVLDLSEDEWGQAFRFVVNGRPIFAKGANWIPAHSFVVGLTRKDLERDLQAAADAHMNMIRVWGGGIYESEEFYDVCDELGLMVWQDFAFACTLYPIDESFRELIRPEATAQIRRLRHRASLALWCGNNEIWMLNRTTVTDETQGHIREAYEKIFHEMLPEVVAENDPATSYWPSSPWRRDGIHGHEAGETSGDSHFWDVWHSRKPIKSYELWKFRFVSEFGMQSYSSAATNATFCPADDTNVFGPTMENHQKNAAGNQIILDYVSRQYRFPKTQEDLIYLSQLNQARCMQMGVEHYRRLMPRCMGSLYWQLNDCWPVASWSSIEFTGRWKALHYAARRFYAPALVSAHVPGDEQVTIGNYRKSTMDVAHLYTVYDAPTPTKGVVCWDLMHIDGHRIGGGTRKVVLRPGEAVKQKTLDLHRLFKKTSHDDVYVRIGLEIDGERVSEETVLLASPRFMHLPRGKVRCAVKALDAHRFRLTFTSPVLQHRFAFDLDGLDYRASDNFFELYPQEAKSVVVTLKRKVTAAKLREKLSWRSLVDTY